MKKYAMLLLAAAFMFSVAVVAQDQTTSTAKKVDTKEVKTPEQKKALNEKRVSKMAKELSLTDAEKTQVLGVFENENLKGKAKDAEIKKIIGDEKYEKYQAMKASMKGKKDGTTSTTEKKGKKASEKPTEE
jgi:Spy/CpxP family protein refolding chaperone